MILSLPLLSAAPADVGHPRASPLDSKLDLSVVVVFSGFLAAIRTSTKWFATISRVGHRQFRHQHYIANTCKHALDVDCESADVEIDFQYEAVMRYHVLLAGILRITIVIRALLAEVMK